MCVGCLVEGPVDIAFDDVVPDVLSILKDPRGHTDELKSISEKSEGVKNDDDNTKSKKSHRSSADMDATKEDFRLLWPHHHHHSMDLKVTEVVEESAMEVQNFSARL